MVAQQSTCWAFSDKWTHLFGYRGIFLALRPAMHLLDIFRQMDAKYSGYRLVLADSLWVPPEFRVEIWVL